MYRTGRVGEILPMYPMEAIMKKSRVFRLRFIPAVWFASVGPGRQNQALGCPYVCTIKTVNVSAEGPAQGAPKAFLTYDPPNSSESEVKTAKREG